MKSADVPAPIDPAVADRSAEGLPACPVCGASAWSSHRPGTRLRSCRGCGTLLNDRSFSRQEEETRYDHCASVVVHDEDPVSQGQWQWISHQLPRTSGDRPVRVLDVGCGKGGFLAAAKEAGAEVHGLELDPSVAEVARQRGIPVTQGSLFDVGVPAGPWDVITLWDVLDHLDDPAGALQLLMRELAPGGVLVVRGRNAQIHAPLKALYARRRNLFEGLKLPDLSVVHRWGWTPQGWRRLLERAGLEAPSIHAGLPTPGDRYGTMGPRMLSAALKGAVRGVGTSLFRVTGGKAYPFPSVLVSARKPVHLPGPPP